MSIKSNKILILTTAYLPHIGGSELAIKNITDRINDYEFDLITARLDRGLSKQEQIGHIEVFRVGGFWGSISFLLPKIFLPLAVFLKAVPLLKKNNYQIIHAFQASGAAGAGWLLKICYPNLKFIVTLQEGKNLKEQGRLINFFRKIILKKADYILTISNYLADYAKSADNNVPVDIIPNGVDLEKFSGNPDLNGYKIITVSRLVPKNGIEDLIKAMPEVIKKFNEANLTVIGAGELFDKIKFLIKEMHLESKIKLVGGVNQEQLPHYLSKADLFVRPSVSEGLGSAFLEAMAVGLPVVGTNVGGIPDFLREGDTGYIWARGVSTLAGTIIEVFSYRDEMKEFAYKGKEFVRKEYDWNKIAEKYKKIYSQF